MKIFLIAQVWTKDVSYLTVKSIFSVCVFWASSFQITFVYAEHWHRVHSSSRLM